MAEASRFEVNVPVEVAEQQWRRFRVLFDTSGVGDPAFEPAGPERVRLRFAGEPDLALQRQVAADFARFAESDLDPDMPPITSEPTDTMGGVLTRKPGESGMPLVGKLGSPGAPGSGVDSGGAMDKFPRKRP